MCIINKINAVMRSSFALILFSIAIAPGAALAQPSDVDDVILVLEVSSGSGEFASSGTFIFDTINETDPAYQVYELVGGGLVEDFNGTYTYTASTGRLSMTVAEAPGVTLTTSLNFSSPVHGSYSVSSAVGNQEGSFFLVRGFVEDYYYNGGPQGFQWFYAGPNRSTTVFYHEIHGYVFFSASGYCYMFDGGWCYYSNYPYLYFPTRAEWLYYLDGNFQDGRWFFNLTNPGYENF
jgi:hypothetical protein